MIYVACPPYFATGGTELLHQFGAGLMARGVDVRMLYDEAEGDPVAFRLKSYGVPFVIRIDDPQDTDIIVTPEVLTHLLYKYPGPRRVIWWLSVDFYAASIWSARGIKRRFVDKSRVYQFDDPGVTHFVQSRHAHNFLTARKVVVDDYLSDYLSDDFIGRATLPAETARRPVVLYNPKKGIRHTNRLRRIAGDLEFQPIENMMPSEVFDAMRTAAAYIDFGEHPGKDRIPREAAICGCVIIVGRRGAAANAVDVPIDEEFKFGTDARALAAAAALLRSVVRAPADHAPRFDRYRATIADERRVFDMQLDRFVTRMIGQPEPLRRKA